MNYKQKLDKVQEVLEENLGLNWIDRMVYNPYNGSYHTADMFDFYADRPTYAYLQDEKKKNYRAQVTLNSNSFIIKMNGMTIDASAHWQELLENDASPKQIK